MATSGSVFSDTLQEITNTKLDELSKRRAAFEDARSSLLASTEEDAVSRLAALSDGIKKAFAIKLDKSGKVMTDHTKHKRLEIELKNIDRFLDQAKCDPSISAKLLDAWEQTLLRHLNMESLKFEYASLYGRLVTEWLAGDESSSDAEAYEVVGDAKKLESRMEWENTVFEPADVDKHALETYLLRLFDEEKKPISKALEQLRTAVDNHEALLSRPNQFNTWSLKWTIRGLLVSDLLTNEKREVLKDFLGSDVILKEIADVLNMRMGALGSWTWNSPVQVEMRRKISGVYNIHMHEDLLEAIFLQFIGVNWSVFFKNALKAFHDSQGAWSSTSDAIPQTSKLRLEYYLGPIKSSVSLQKTRRTVYNDRYFMAQLMNYEQENIQNADGEEEAEDDDDNEGFCLIDDDTSVLRDRKLASPPDMRTLDDERDSLDDVNEPEDSGRNSMALKQTLLHLLSTELSLNTGVYGDLTAFHSVFKSWNHLLPHETVFAVLKFFGVSETWLGFFKTFLEAPLKFTDDGESTPTRTRRRGTPSSHVLSDVFGETMLFCLDFAVNQSTSNVLWRTQDDMWFWSRDHDQAVEAWKTIEEFTRVTATVINPSKTGTIRVRDAPDESLPKGDIRWGFLRLSPKGRFEIDQKMVDNHIKELQKQLQGKQKSIFGFIQAWNTYALTFFNSNFGKAANCFGREHVDEMLATHKRIQRQVFSTLSKGDVSDVAEYLKRALGQRFGIKDVPDGHLFFPMELGGLELRSPFISLLQIRDEVLESPSDPVDAFLQEEREAYERAKAAFDDGTTTKDRHLVSNPDWKPESTSECENFMSFEEYTRYREEFKSYFHRRESRLHNVFRRLMQRPDEERINSDDGPVRMALKELGQSSRGITQNWGQMEPYWQWVATMYGPEVVDRFGGLNIVVPGSLPMGMVTLFRDKRVKW